MRAGGRSRTRTRRSDDSLFWAWMCGSEAASVQTFVVFSAGRCADTRPSLNWAGWAEPTGDTGPVGSTNMSDLTVQLRPARAHAHARRELLKESMDTSNGGCCCCFCYLVCKIASPSASSWTDAAPGPSRAHEQEPSGPALVPLLWFHLCCRLRKRC